MNRVLSGNIFEVIVPNDQKRYFQYVCKDLSLLNGDVIRVFSRSYAMTASPTVEEIICDEVDCYMHTAVGAGVKFGLWTYYGRSKNVGSKEVYFRDANDYGHYPGERIVSHNWTVWKINGERKYVGTLPEEYYSAYIGLLFSPFSAAYRITYGRYKMLYYPLYR
mgnify:FL=1